MRHPLHLTLRVTAGDDLGQIAVAGGVLAERDDAGALCAFAGEPEVRADDRLNPARLRRTVEFHHRKQRTLIGHRDRRHPERGHSIDQIINADQAIDDGILAVEVQMHKHVLDLAERGLVKIFRLRGMDPAGDQRGELHDSPLGTPMLESHRKRRGSSESSLTGRRQVASTRAPARTTAGYGTSGRWRPSTQHHRQREHGSPHRQHGVRIPHMIGQHHVELVALGRQRVLGTSVAQRSLRRKDRRPAECCSSSRVFGRCRCWS